MRFASLVKRRKCSIHYRLCQRESSHPKIGSCLDFGAYCELIGAAQAEALVNMDHPARHREELLNVALAACISARGMEADPETIISGARKPDVIASFRGLRCVIEGKLADVPNARAIVLEDARRRLDQGLAHLTIGAVYPRNLRSTAIGHLATEMGAASLEFCVLTEGEIGSWHKGGIDEILSELRRAHEDIVQDDVLQRAVDTLNLGLAEVSNALYGNVAVCDRLIQVLGIGDKPDAPAI